MAEYFSSSSFGSIIVALPCRKGILIASDRRSCHLNHNDRFLFTTDMATKLHKVSDSCIFGVTGFASESAVVDGVASSFTPATHIRNFLKNSKPVTLMPYKSQFDEYLERNFRVFMRGRPIKAYRSDWAEDGVRSVSIVFNYNRESKSYEVMHTKLCAMAEDLTVKAESTFSSMNHKDAAMIVLGESRVASEVKSGIRKGCEIAAPFLSNRRSPSTDDVDVPDAKQAVLEIMRKTHEECCVTVGATVDMFLLSPVGIIQLWFGKNLYK